MEYQNVKGGTMNIAVLYEDELYMWVDTVVRHDEYEYVCAVLVHPKFGTVITREINTVRVISKDIVD